MVVSVFLLTEKGKKSIIHKVKKENKMVKSVIDKFIEIHNLLGEEHLPDSDIEEVEERIVECEEELGIEFDPLLKYFWRNQAYFSFGHLRCPNFYRFFDPSFALKMRDTIYNMYWDDETGEPKPWDDDGQGLLKFPTDSRYFSRLWIPFLDIGRVYRFFIDYNPSSKGKAGQIAVYAAELEFGIQTIYVIADSFEELVTLIVNGYERDGKLPLLANGKRMSMPYMDRDFDCGF